MARPIKVFEPITKDQIVKVNARAAETGLPEAVLYDMITELAGIPLMTALSKQEAIVLIERLQGESKELRPAWPRCEDEVDGDGSQLASYYHVYDIRLMFKALGWDREEITHWLEKYRKVKNIRSMDRMQARATWAILKKMAYGKVVAHTREGRGWQR